MRPVRFAGGVFGDLHAALMGQAAELPPFDPGAVSSALLAEAQATWADRVRTEFRSTQIMIRFLTEVVGAGDPIDVYAGAAELVTDEIRHVALCAALTKALGGDPRLPDPVRLADPPGFSQASMGERALHTGITMLLVNETISVAFITDLAARCRLPAVKHVLDATLADEDGHGAFGESYVRASLRRFPASTKTAWRGLVQQTLAPHRRNAARALEGVPPARQHLEAWPEPDRADLGLFSPTRQALVFREAERGLLATLRRLDLVD